MKDPYVAKPLPTENNLVTEEGGMSNSFHFYGTADNRILQKQPVIASGRHYQNEVLS